jgi:hypothetical protein
VRYGTYSSVHVYKFSCRQYYVTFILRHDFYNTIFKIKHKLYIAFGSSRLFPPPPGNEKFWMHTYLTGTESGNANWHGVVPTVRFLSFSLFSFGFQFIFLLNRTFSVGVVYVR